MANITASLLALGTVLHDELQSTANNNFPLARIVPVRAGAGDACRWAVRDDDGYGKAESYTELQDVTSHSNDVEVALSLAWAGLRSNKKISDRALDVALSSESPADSQNQLGSRLREAVKDVVCLMANQCFRGNASGDIIGFDSQIEDSGSVGGVDRADSAYDFLRSKVNYQSGAITLKQLRGYIHEREDASGRKINYGVCNSSVFNILSGLFDSQRQFHMIPVSGPNGEIVLRGGVDVIEVDGCQIVRDKNASDGKLYLLGEDSCELLILPPATGELVGVADGQGALPFSMRVTQLPADGMYKRFSVHTTAQLRVLNPFACAQVIGISS